MNANFYRAGTYSTDLETRLAEIWCRVLEVSLVGPHDNFFALGGDSLAAAKILDDVGHEFGCNLPLSVLLDAATVTDLAQALRQAGNLSDWLPLVHLQSAGVRPPLFIVHGVGGDVLSFADLARFLSPAQPLIGIRTLTAAGSTPTYRTIAKMSAEYIKAIRRVQPKGPYLISGYSFGGSVALEIAQQLYARGEHVAFVGIIDHTLPPYRYRPMSWTPSRLAEFSVNAFRWLVEDIWRTGRGRRWSACFKMVAKAKRLITGRWWRREPESGQTDAEAILACLGADVPDHFRQLMAGHYEALRQYVPKPYPGRVTLLRARTRPLFRVCGYDLGWEAFADGGLEVKCIPGNHETILREPNVRWLAEAIKVSIGRAINENRASYHSAVQNGDGGGHINGSIGATPAPAVGGSDSRHSLGAR